MPAHKTLCVVLVTVFAALMPYPLHARPPETTLYPRIRALDTRDPVFAQLQDDVELSRRRLAQSLPLPPLAFYSYVVGDDEDYYFLSARLSVGQSTLASINGILNPDDLKPGDLLFVPNSPSLFVPVTPRTDLEHIMHAAHSDELAEAATITLHAEMERSFYYLPGTEFSRLELAYFRGILFRFPLPTGRLTSGYGTRESPITGKMSFHAGIDIAASEGTPVMAARPGKVTNVGNHGILGNFVIISHEAGYQTVYGHMNSIRAQLHDVVNSGTIIGTVGRTGLTTGPHLHFEVRFRGGAQDPLQYVPGGTE